MPLLALSLGSNVDPARHLRGAAAALRQRFGELRLSPVYESRAVGFDGDNFLNLVALASTDEALGSIVNFLKDLEDQAGRDRSQPRFSARTLDVDVIFYGEHSGADCGMELPRDEVTRHAFVLRPMADLVPNLVHDPSGLRYGELWQEFSDSRQKLWPVAFAWDDESSS